MYNYPTPRRRCKKQEPRPHRWHYIMSAVYLFVMEDASKLPILARIGAVWVVITAGKISISGVTEYSRYPYGEEYLLRTECSKLPKNGSSHTTTTPYYYSVQQSSIQYGVRRDRSPFSVTAPVSALHVHTPYRV